MNTNHPVANHLVANPLVEKYGKNSMWVSHDEKKIPLIGNSSKRADSTDSSTWTTAENIKGKNLGIVLHDRRLVCIDIDHVLVGGKLQQENVAELLVKANSFTEISRSGTGLHIFFEVSEPITITTNKKKPFEVYNSNRYIAVTGVPWGNILPVRVVSPKEAFEIINLAVPQKEPLIAPTGADILNTPEQPDDIVLKKMFNSKNGADIKKLYDGDIEGYENDYSSADLALCGHLAFWTGKNIAQTERLWMLSPLGARDGVQDKYKKEKTKTRKDYRDRTVLKAIGSCKTGYVVPEVSKLDLLYTTDKDGKKIYTLNTENIYRVLKHHEQFRGTLRFDEFKAGSGYEIRHGAEWKEITDADEIHIQKKISILFPQFARVSKLMVRDAMCAVFSENIIDSARDYMTSLLWDKTPRLDTWLTTVYGTPDDAYHRAVGANWMKSLVKRLVIPGCKADFVFVLEGAQGIKKSTSLSILGGDWHTETTTSTENKDFFMLFSGKAIVEFSEGETLSRTEVKRMKSIITMQKDRYRPPYAKSPRDFARRCVFAMTTNEDQYLKDDTGNRRWLPVRVLIPEINTDWLAKNREQLFAEAYHRAITLNETTYEFPKEETLAMQNTRIISNPNESIVADWYAKLTDSEKKEGITILQVAKDALDKKSTPGYMMKKFEEMDIGSILKNHLKLIKKRIMQNGYRAIRWYPEGVEVPDDMEVEELKEKKDNF